jgi:hypothetical protein
MDSLVQEEAFTANENFSTFFTLVRVLCTVESLMVHKIGGLSKGFSTFITFIGFFPRVDSLVQNEAFL